MSAPELTAAVEKAAEDHYEELRKRYPPMPPWGEADAIDKHNIRKAVLPIVTSVGQMLYDQGYQACAVSVGRFDLLPEITDAMWQALQELPDGSGSE